MQAIILAGGKGTRMLLITETVPKAMVLVGGNPLLEHVFNSLPNAITEVIVVVGYMGQQVADYFGDEYKGVKIKYVWQQNQRGTGDALFLCKDQVKGKFLMLFCDDIHDKESLTSALEYPRAILVKEHDAPENFGVVFENEDGTLRDIIEKPKVPPSNLVSTGALVLDRNIFDEEKILHPSGEFYLTDMTSSLAKKMPIHVYRQEIWISVGRLEDIAPAEALLKNHGL